MSILSYFLIKVKHCPIHRIILLKKKIILTKSIAVYIIIMSQVKGKRKCPIMLCVYVMIVANI